MRYFAKVAVVLTLTILALGCATAAKREAAAVREKRFVDYQRIAIVCAPAPGHEPLYAKLIAKEADMKVASRLGRYIEKAVVLYDVPIDASVSPPKISLGSRSSEYDGVVVLIYSYGSGIVYLDMDMIDVNTGKSVWHYQIASDDLETSRRLIRDGMWTPTIVKQEFYGF